MRGTLKDVVAMGSITRVEFEVDGRLVVGHGDTRPTMQAFEAMGGVDAMLGQDFDFEIEGWGGLAWLCPVE